MPNEQPLRVYADTSVYGGVFDTQFLTQARTFFDQVRAGRFTLVMSSLVETELEPAPEQVRSFVESIRPLLSQAPVSDDALDLQAAYLRAGVVGEASATDALHVAIATCAACPLLVSWNFKHIVHRDKAPKYNAVNTLVGRPTIGI
jgi:hypothetical protein